MADLNGREILSEERMMTASRESVRKSVYDSFPYRHFISVS